MWELGEGAKLKKFINAPADYVEESLVGMVNAFPLHYRRTGTANRVITRALKPDEARVGVISGGGSGHLPVFCGYVGPGLLDACAVGEVFAAPAVEQVVQAIEHAHSGHGVLCVFGNYGGDVMNLEMAVEMAELLDIETASVLVNDDVAAAPAAEAHKRRGVAGLVFAFKIAGAAAAAGYPLVRAAEVTRRAVQNIRSIGVALTPCAVPQAGKPTFYIAEAEMAVGMGLHGEPGIRRASLASADSITDELFDTLDADRPLVANDRVAILVNSLGATPLEELFIVYRRLAQRLSARGVICVTPLIGRYATSMEMTGASISLMRLDEELERLLRAPATCPFWTYSP